MRVDGRDLALHALAVRRLFRGTALSELTMFASDNLDEGRIAAVVAAGASIDGFGVGKALDTSGDRPSLDAA